MAVKHPAIVNRKGVIFQMDNARPHTAKKTQKFLNDSSIETLPHPPCSPDLAPSDYHLFRSMNNALVEEQFRDDDDVKMWLAEFIASKEKSFLGEGNQ